MKDQYAGDINDYRKYGLLRTITESSDLSLAVCWMLTAPDGRRDGRHTTYLSNTKRWRKYDPLLFDALSAVVVLPSVPHLKGQDQAVSNGQEVAPTPSLIRGVVAVERCGILGSARFWSALVPDGAPGRQRYVADVLNWAVGADLLFFDPDNGLEVSSTAFGHRGSSKYLYWHEAKTAFERGHSLLIYQHFPRKSRAEYVPHIASALAQSVGVQAVHTLQTSNVVFLLAPQPQHEARIARVLENVNRRWAEQIRVVTVALNR